MVIKWPAMPHLDTLGSWAILTSSMWPYLPLSTFILFFFLFIDINYFLENTTTTSNRQRIITISFQPRQDALPLYEIASSSTVYGFYFLLIFPIIPFTFLLQFSFQSFHFLFYGYKKVYPFIFHSCFFPSIISHSFELCFLLDLFNSFKSVHG